MQCFISRECTLIYEAGKNTLPSTGADVIVRKTPRFIARHPVVDESRWVYRPAMNGSPLRAMTSAPVGLPAFIYQIEKLMRILLIHIIL